MSASIGFQESLSKPLDETAWKVWVAKGREQDRRGNAALVKTVEWVSIVALLAAAALWSQLAPYDVVVRFIVAAGSLVLMFHAFHSRHYALATVFAALALIYNPVAPVFSVMGDWKRAVVVASAAPFVASLAWRNARTAPAN